MSIYDRMIFLSLSIVLHYCLTKTPDLKVTSDFNLVRCSWQCPCVHHHGMTTYVRASSRVSSHIQYINSDLRIHLFVAMTSFCPYVVPYLIRGLCPRNNCAFLFLFFCLHAVETFFNHFTLSPRCILSCIPLFKQWIQFFLLLSPCWTRFLLGLI